MIRWLLNRLPCFEIADPSGDPYLRRYTLLRVPLLGWKLMLHEIIRPDYARELHDHPWWFWTMILRGGYVEQVRTDRPPAGEWEVAGDDGEMVHIRWSVPAEDGSYLWCAHYPATPWGRHAIERLAAEWNATGVGWWNMSRGEKWRPIEHTIAQAIRRPLRAYYHPADYAHVITELPKGKAWTLVLRGTRSRMWGFFTSCGWMPWRAYCDRVYNGLPVCEDEEPTQTQEVARG